MTISLIGKKYKPLIVNSKCAVMCSALLLH